MTARSLRTAVALAASAAALAGDAHAADAPDPQTRAAMARIVEALQVALPLSLDDATFSAEDNRATLRAAIEALARSGEALTSHGNPTDAGFAFLSRSLARDTRAIRMRFERKEWEQARFLLQEVTENCVACHSRRPDPLARPLGRRLVDDAALAALPLAERVRLEVATRQFDRALESYAALFADPSVSGADLDLMGHVDDYLEVCLRVRSDTCDPLPTLERLGKRADLPAGLRRNLEAWQTSVRALSARGPLTPGLAEPRRLVEKAQDREHFPDDRSALVLYFTASGLLNRYLAEGQPGLDELADAYTQLGVIESRVGRSFWPSEAEYYFEAAIRVAPGAPAAQRAYALLEESIAVGYSGSAGLKMPDDERERLAGLRRLIREARLGVPPE